MRKGRREPRAHLLRKRPCNDGADHDAEQGRRQHQGEGFVNVHAHQLVAPVAGVACVIWCVGAGGASTHCSPMARSTAISFVCS